MDYVYCVYLKYSRNVAFAYLKMLNKSSEYESY